MDYSNTNFSALKMILDKGEKLEEFPFERVRAEYIPNTCVDSVSLDKLHVFLEPNLKNRTHGFLVYIVSNRVAETGEIRAVLKGTIISKLFLLVTCVIFFFMVIRLAMVGSLFSLVVFLIFFIGINFFFKLVAVHAKYLVNSIY